ncbi:hypothetical protein FNF31_07128 [Cafeteria roenbergensis]|uniref:Uncharacterized protein n=1 Tax=Cafeteria roenbergensis TaxID=33653 RepID=A0A5A8CDP4_CAFRO|nr:hypothetical protein FNF31_07128 [Cafeteria roenbergensis]KAA0161542.1 hypothetical protein FNF28_04999 [Cafeteria roenbergensis]
MEWTFGMVASLMSPEPRSSPSGGQARDESSRLSAAGLATPHQTPPKGSDCKAGSWTELKSPEEFAPVGDYKSPASTPVGGVVHKAARRVREGIIGAASPASAPFDQASPFEGAAHAGLVALLASSVTSRALAECSLALELPRLSVGSALVQGAAEAAAAATPGPDGGPALPSLDAHRRVVEGLSVAAAQLEQFTPACGPVSVIRQCLGAERASLAELEAEQAALEWEEAVASAKARHVELEPAVVRAQAVCTAAALLHKADIDSRVAELREELRQRMVEEKERLTKVAKRMADRVERLRDRAEEEARAAERRRKEREAKAKAEKAAEQARAAAIQQGQSEDQAAAAAADALEDALHPLPEESEEKRAWRESLRADGDRCRRLATAWKDAALRLKRRRAVALYSADEAGFAPTAQDLTSRLNNFTMIFRALNHALNEAGPAREPQQTVLDLAAFPFIKALNEDVFDKLDSIDLLQGSDSLLAPVFSTGGLVASLAVVAPGFWQRLWCGASVDCAAVGPRPLHRGESDSLDSHLMARARARIACLVAALAAGASMSVSDEQPLHMQRRAAPWTGDPPHPRFAAQPCMPAQRLDDEVPDGIENGEFGDQLWTWLARSANVCMDDNGAAYHRLQAFTVTIILRLAGWSLARRFGEKFAQMLKTLYEGRSAIANAAATKSGNAIEAGIIAENIRKEVLKLAEVRQDGSVALRHGLQRPVGWQGIALTQAAAVDVE